MAEVSTDIAVRGIGGVFLYAEDPEELSEWYREHLGLACGYNSVVGAYYRDFRQREYGDTSRVLRTTWAILKRPADAAAAHDAVIINYLVPDLPALIDHLRANGIAVEKEEKFDYGHFAWITDPEGNKIELFQDFNAYVPPDI